VIEENEILKQKIIELEKENTLLRSGITSFLATGKTVNVPPEIEPIFDEAEKTVANYFKNLKASPSKGLIEINDERYVLLRASSLSYGFLNKIKDLYADKGDEEAYLIGRSFLFDIAHVLGLEDAKNFHLKMDLSDSISKLSVGPIHFAYTGWAFVDILPESNPEPNENFYLKYQHPYSFEADSWIKEGVKSNYPVCIMNSGYSSGWCQESFGMPLTAIEIECRAKGDDNCTFIMAPPEKINEYLPKSDKAEGTENVYDVPLFFKRKESEEKIKQTLKEKDVLLKEVHHRVKNNLQIISSLLNLQSNYINNKEALDLFLETKNRIKTLALVHEKLYKSDDVEFVNLKLYFQSIIDLLSYSYDKEYIETKINVDNDVFKQLDIDKAIPCGLIFNEIISNSYKHAFNKRLEGIIEITINYIEEQCVLTIKDNGVGLPKDMKIKELDSLGIGLIDSLVTQLEGTYSVDGSKGTVYEITFPI
jgi:two-component sensor histidine kinase/predicted hydrocarbon binding protein